MSTNDEQRRFFANRPETPPERKIYDYIRAIATLDNAEIAVQKYYDFLFEIITCSELDPGGEARSALQAILKNSEIDGFLSFMINRCFYTIGNLWRGQVGRHAQLQALVEKAVALPMQTPQDQLVKRLRKAMQAYVNDETLYTPLKRQLILLRPEPVEANCLGDTFKSYFFIYESAAVTRDIPVEYRQSIREQRQAKAQLHHHQLRAYQAAHLSGKPSLALNPTRISDSILPQVIHTFDPLRPDSYHEQARTFAANQTRMRMLGGFQDEFHAYVMDPLIQESSRYRDNRFSRFVRDEIRKFRKADKADIPLTEITITQICSRLLKLFVCNSLENPETGYFKYLIDNVGHQALTAVLLKIVLFRRKVLPWFEDRFGILFHLWEKCQLASVDWLVQSFEHMNVALALNMTPLNYEPKILLSSR